MFKSIVTLLLLATVALATAKPGLIQPALLTAHHHSAALVSAPFVAARSSQVIARNYNGIVAAAPLVHHHQPLVAAYSTHPVFTSDASTYSSYTTYPQHFAPAPVLVGAGAPLKYVAAAGPVHF